jgi:hypothetical protein
MPNLQRHDARVADTERRETEQQADSNVETRAKRIAVPKELPVLVNERRERGQAADETDCDAGAHFRRKRTALLDEGEDNAEHHAAGDVHGERAPGKPDAQGPVQPHCHEIASDSPKCASKVPQRSLSSAGCGRGPFDTAQDERGP